MAAFVTQCRRGTLNFIHFDPRVMNRVIPLSLRHPAYVQAGWYHFYCATLYMYKHSRICSVCVLPQRKSQPVCSNIYTVGLSLRCLQYKGDVPTRWKTELTETKFAFAVVNKSSSCSVGRWGGEGHCFALASIAWRGRIVKRKRLTA